VNFLNYCLQTKNISKAFAARRLAKFGVADAWKALVHPSI
jgi:hypothetical protein